MQQFDQDDVPDDAGPALEIPPAINARCRKNDRFRVLVYFLSDQVFLVRCMDTGELGGQLTRDNPGDVIGEIRTDHAGWTLTLTERVVWAEDPPSCFKEQSVKLRRDEADRSRLRQAAPPYLGLNPQGYLQ